MFVPMLLNRFRPACDFFASPTALQPEHVGAVRIQATTLHGVLPNRWAVGTEEIRQAEAHLVSHVDCPPRLFLV